MDYTNLMLIFYGMLVVGIIIEISVRYYFWEKKLYGSFKQSSNFLYYYIFGFIHGGLLLLLSIGWMELANWIYPGVWVSLKDSNIFAYSMLGLGPPFSLCFIMSFLVVKKYHLIQKYEQRLRDTNKNN